MVSSLEFFARNTDFFVVYSSKSCMLVLSFCSFFMLNVIDSPPVSHLNGGVITFKGTGFPLWAVLHMDRTWNSSPVSSSHS